MAKRSKLPTLRSDTVAVLLSPLARRAAERSIPKELLLQVHPLITGNSAIYSDNRAREVLREPPFPVDDTRLAAVVTSVGVALDPAQRERLRSVLGHVMGRVLRLAEQLAVPEPTRSAVVRRLRKVEATAGELRKLLRDLSPEEVGILATLERPADDLGARLDVEATASRRAAAGFESGRWPLPEMGASPDMVKYFAVSVLASVFVSTYGALGGKNTRERLRAFVVAAVAGTRIVRSGASLADESIDSFVNRVYRTRPKTE